MITHFSKHTSSNKEKGFSLVELLVVIAILAVLAAIAIPLFLNQRERSYRATAQADGRNLAMDITSAFSGCMQTGATTPAAFLSTGVQNTVFTSPSGANISPAGCASPTTFTFSLSTNSTISSSLAGGALVNNANGWCFVVSNNNQQAKYNKKGLASSGTGLSCAATAADLGTN